MFCTECGANIDGARFCTNCGKPIGKVISTNGSEGKKQTTQASGMQAGNKMQPQSTVNKYSAAQGRSMPQAYSTLDNVMSLNASSMAGEMAFEEPGTQENVLQLAAVYSPVAGIFAGIGSYLKGILSIIKKPSVLFGTIFLAIFMYLTVLFRDADSEMLRAIAWLTYAEGGFDRSQLGMIGGILGRGAVIAALLSVFRGGVPNAFKGIGAFFVGHGEKRGFFTVIFGMLLGFAAYVAFVGVDATSDAAMAGIAGAVLSLQALGSKSGKLYALAQSFSSSKQDGMRQAREGKADGILNGLTIGFAFGTVFTMLGLMEEFL